jgi:predicted DCC family thiol-disulfide oxidoreductase YuxK
MKTLKDHLILYDAECPMCNLYTRAFTSTGMLDDDGRAPYQNLKTFSCPTVDRKRAVNEIALVNTKTGEVSYGIDSLFKVIGNACPLFKPLFNLKPFAWAMRKFYAFISYNRKVIIPAPQTASPTLQPDFSLRHRIAWLVFATLTAAAILTHYSHLLPYPGNAAREYMICTGQLIFQGFIASVIAPAKRWDYLGNMMTISLAGSLLLLPVIPLHPNPALATGWFAMVATAMFFEHLRRCKLLGVGRLLTITWLFYRVALLGVIVLTAPR